MDFRQLEAFIKVVELANFSQAARELHISQPSVSNYIASLERELKTTLINRSTKVLSTTLAGERFLEKAREMMVLKRESIEMLQNLSDDVSGDIRILASSVPALYILPQLMASFHELNPNVSFTMHQGNTSDVVQGIATHSADVGFAGSVLGGGKCDFYGFTSEKLLFIGPNDGSYSESEGYSLEDLLYSGRFISRESGSGTRIQYEHYFVEHDIVLEKVKTCATMDSVHSIVNAVMEGLGISIVSEQAVRPLLDQKLLVAINVYPETPERKIYAVLSNRIAHSHLTKLFLEHIGATVSTSEPR